MIKISKNILKLQQLQKIIGQYKCLASYKLINVQTFTTINNEDNQIQSHHQRYINDDGFSYNNINHNRRKQQSDDYLNKSKQMQQNQYFDLDKPLFQYNGNKQNLANWLLSPKTYTHILKQNKVNSLTTQFDEEIQKLNLQINDVGEAINVYLKLFVICRFYNPQQQYSKYHLNKFAENIKNSQSDEELLMILTFETLKYIRLRKIEQNNKIPVFMMARLTIYTCYKFGFYLIIENMQDMDLKKQSIEEMIHFIQFFHIQKLNKKVNLEKLHELYDNILTLALKINFEPTLQFSIQNISMLADIKQQNKHMQQKIKIHNSLFFRECLTTIKTYAERIDNYLLVFIIYKISAIDHYSYGCNLDSLWQHCEERLLNKFDQFKLIQRKSLLYSLGKSLIQTNSTNDLIKKLLDIKQLNKEKQEDGFLEYLGNIILFGITRSLLNQKNMKALFPLIKELMEDDKISKQDKVQFISNTCAQIYRIEIYDDNYWFYFRKYEQQLLADKSSFFSLYFISKTLPVFADEIFNKELVSHCTQLYQNILQVPNFKENKRDLIRKGTQVQQNLFELRFGYFLNAFGRPFTREKIIDEIFSADFYLENEMIAVEIQGNNHYIKQIDGTFKQNAITQFKIKYLKKIGIQVINLGLPNVVQSPTQHSTLLREFQNQFNRIIKNKSKNEKLNQETKIL